MNKSFIFLYHTYICDDPNIMKSIHFATSFVDFFIIIFFFYYLLLFFCLLLSHNFFLCCDLCIISIFYKKYHQKKIIIIFHSDCGVYYSSYLLIPPPRPLAPNRPIRMTLQFNYKTNGLKSFLGSKGTLVLD